VAHPSAPRDDRGVTEVIAYVLMFGIGALVLTFSMNLLVDAQSRGNDLAEAKQNAQVAQVTASLTEQAANVAQRAANATFATSFDMPKSIRSQGFTVSYEVSNSGCPYEANVTVDSPRDHLGTNVSLGDVSNVTVRDTCLRLSGDVHSSARQAQIRFDPHHGSSQLPTIVLEPKTQ